MIITKRKSRKIVTAWNTDLRTVQPKVREVPSLATVIKREGTKATKPARYARRRERKLRRKAWWRLYGDDVLFALVISAMVLIIAGLTYAGIRHASEPPSAECLHDKKMIALIQPRIAAAEIRFAVNPTQANDDTLVRLQDHYDNYDNDRSYDC